MHKGERLDNLNKKNDSKRTEQNSLFRLKKMLQQITIESEYYGKPK